MISSSCDEIFKAAKEVIWENIEQNVNVLPILKKAQMCKDLEFMIKSMPWFKRIIVRRATHGVGKISVGGFNQWFKLEAEYGYLEAKERLEMIIKAELQSELI